MSVQAGQPQGSSRHAEKIVNIKQYWLKCSAGVSVTQKDQIAACAHRCGCQPWRSEDAATDIQRKADVVQYCLEGRSGKDTQRIRLNCVLAVVVLDVGIFR